MIFEIRETRITLECTSKKVYSSLLYDSAANNSEILFASTEQKMEQDYLEYTLVNVTDSKKRYLHKILHFETEEGKTKFLMENL